MFEALLKALSGERDWRMGDLAEFLAMDRVDLSALTGE